jgi:HSP20 family protein
MTIQKMEALKDAAQTPVKTGKNQLTYARFPALWRAPDNTVVWSPLMEMYTDRNNLVVRMEIPGAEASNIDAKIIGNDLVVRGERRAKQAYGNQDYLRCEFSYGKFSRTIALPTEIRKNSIKASYDDGVLEILLPRAATSSEKRIEIETNGRRRSHL